VGAALDHIAHQPGLDRQAFHLCNPKPQRSGEVMNAFARAAHAPQLTVRIDSKLLKALPKGTMSMLMQLPAARGVRNAILADFGKAAATKIANAGGIQLLVARSLDKLEQTRQEIEDLGGTAYVYTADVSDPDSIEDLVIRVLADHPAIDVLVNNAGKSIRRSI